MTATEREALILEHMELAGRLAGAHAGRTGADTDEAHSDAYLGLVVGVDRWLESDRSVEVARWISVRVVYTMKEQWRLRGGVRRSVPTPRAASLDELADIGWQPGASEAGYAAIVDRDFLEWLEREAAADLDMQLAVAAASATLAQLAAAQDPPVTDSAVCKRVRNGRRKLRELAAQSF